MSWGCLLSELNSHWPLPGSHTNFNFGECWTISCHTRWARVEWPHQTCFNKSFWLLPSPWPRPQSPVLCRKRIIWVTTRPECWVTPVARTLQPGTSPELKYPLWPSRQTHVQVRDYSTIWRGIKLDKAITFFVQLTRNTMTEMLEFIVFFQGLSFYKSCLMLWIIFVFLISVF